MSTWCLWQTDYLGGPVARAVFVCSHGAPLTCKLSNQRMDVLGAPRCGCRAEFHWFGEFPACYACPPTACADRDGTWNSTLTIANDLRKSEKTGLGDGIGSHILWASLARMWT